MSASKFYTVPDWNDASRLCQGMLLHLLHERIISQLGRGVHHFTTPDEMLGVIGIIHTQWKSVSVRNVRLGRAEAALVSHEPMFYMSYHMFRRLLRRINDVRLEQNSWAKVEREGRPRLTLIVA